MRPQAPPEGKAAATMGHGLSGAIEAKTHIRALQGQPGMVATKEARSAKSAVGRRGRC